jgi:hypothetical protein
MTKFLRLSSRIPWVLVFALAAFAVRYVLHNAIETRYLILLFAASAALLEFGVGPALGRRRDLIAFLMNVSAAVIALVAMKWMLEGVHPWLQWLIEGFWHRLS